MSRSEKDDNSFEQELFKKFRYNVCLQAQIMALKDKRVQKKLKDKNNEKRLVFYGILCSEAKGIPKGRKGILFKFKGSAGKTFRINPSFMAIVNVGNKIVEKVIEPLGYDDGLLWHHVICYEWVFTCFEPKQLLICQS